jgi:hypothetical protein
MKGKKHRPEEIIARLREGSAAGHIAPRSASDRGWTVPGDRSIAVNIPLL